MKSEFSKIVNWNQFKVFFSLPSHKNIKFSMTQKINIIRYAIAYNSTERWISNWNYWFGISFIFLTNTHYSMVRDVNTHYSMVRDVNSFWKLSLNDLFFCFVFQSFCFRKKLSFLKTTHSFWTLRKRIMIVFNNDR